MQLQTCVGVVALSLESFHKLLGWQFLGICRGQYRLISTDSFYVCRWSVLIRAMEFFLNVKRQTPFADRKSTESRMVLGRFRQIG